MPEEVRERVYHPSGGRVMTKQADAAKTDVNGIMARWIAHGTLPVAGGAAPQFGDFSQSVDYHEALNRVRDADRSFLELPASVRKHCENDPGRFLELVFDPARRGELEELGLVDARAPENAPPADPEKPVVPEPPPEP